MRRSFAPPSLLDHMIGSWMQVTRGPVPQQTTTATPAVGTRTYKKPIQFKDTEPYKQQTGHLLLHLPLTKLCQQQ